MANTMNKGRLLSFIKKYNLGSLVEAVKWEVKDNVLSTQFITGDKTLLGTVSFNDIAMDDGEFGVYLTSQLRSMLEVLSDTVTVKVIDVNGRSVSLKVADSNNHINYMLADLKVIQNPPNLKTLPTWDIRLKIDEQFYTMFRNSTRALGDQGKTFTIVGEDGNLKLILGYSSDINSSSITLNVDGEYDAPFSPISFVSQYLYEILAANQEIKEGELKISTQGLATVSYAAEDFNAAYYLVKLSGAP